MDLSHLHGDVFLVPWQGDDPRVQDWISDNLIWVTEVYWVCSRQTSVFVYQKSLSRDPKTISLDHHEHVNLQPSCNKLTAPKVGLGQPRVHESHFWAPNKCPTFRLCVGFKRPLYALWYDSNELRPTFGPSRSQGYLRAKVVQMNGVHPLASSLQSMTGLNQPNKQMGSSRWHLVGDNPSVSSVSLGDRSFFTGMCY